MLATECAAKLDALVDQIVAGFQDAFHLAGIAPIEQHQRVQVAVSGMEDIRDLEPVMT